MSSPAHGFGSAAAAAAAAAAGASSSHAAPAAAPAPAATGGGGGGGGGGMFGGGFDRLASLATAALTYYQVASSPEPAPSPSPAPRESRAADEDEAAAGRLGAAAAAASSTSALAFPAAALAAAAAAAAAASASAPAPAPAPSAAAGGTPPSSGGDEYRVTKRKYTKRSQYWQQQTGQGRQGEKGEGTSPGRTKSPAKAKKGGAKSATKRGASTKRGGGAGAGTSSAGEDAVIRRGRTRGQVRTRAPSKKMLEIMDDEDDGEEIQPAAAAAKSSGRPTKKAVKSSSASAKKKPAADADAAPTATKTRRKKTPKAAEGSGPGKRAYRKRSNWWGNRSGPNSPTAIARAKKEKATGKPAAKEESPKPRRKYTKKSDFWKKKSGDDEEDDAAASASASKAEGGGRPARKAPKKDIPKSAPSAAAAAKPAAAKKEPGPVDEASDSDDSSVDLGAIVCCVCRCAADYSDPDAFLPAPWMLEDKAEDLANKSDSSDSEGEESDEDEDAKKSDESAAASGAESKSDDEAKGADSEKKKKPSNASADEEDADSDDEEQFHPPLPHNLHDPNNALLLCDGPGCNRAYHQRCHFVPVLSIPRGEWHCLICRVKEDVLGTSPAKGGKGTKRAGNTKQAQRRSSWDASAVSSAVSSVASSDDICLDPDAVHMALTLSELDSLYRVDPPPRPHKKDDKGGEGATVPMKQAPEETIDDVVEEERRKQLQESFELVSAPLKARILNTELTTKVKSIIDQCLSRIRQSENVIRAYTETSRARKSILDRYAMDGQVAQELVQALGKMSMAKQRIRGMLRSLEYIIKTNRSWEVDCLLDWIAKEEQRAQTDGSADPSGDESAPAPPSVPLGDIRDLIFAKGLDKRRVEPRFESGSNEALLFIHCTATSDADAGGSEKKAEQPPGTITTKTSGEEDEELSIDHLTCVQCHLSTSCDDNDLLLCDGAGCFRAVHQNCVHPHVGEEDLAEDVDWFCPYCSALGQWIHYTQVEYLGDDLVDYQREKARRGKEKAKRDRERRRNAGGDDADDEHSHDQEEDSLASWEHPSEVFPEADEEEKVAMRLRHGGKRNERTDRWLCELLHIPYGEDDGTHAASRGDPEDDYDEEDDSDVTSVNSDDDSDDDEDSEDDDEDAASAISKSELNALSDYSSSDDDDSDDEDGEKKDQERSGVRSSKRLRRNQERGQVVPSGRQAKQSRGQPNTALAALLRRSGYSGSGIGTGTGSESSSDSEEDDRPDVGTLDESNIVAGKRNRTKVDYRKLNDAMFGSVDEDEADKMFGKEEDEYNWAKAMSKKSRKRRSSASSSSSDDDSSSDEDSSDEEKGNAGGGDSSDGDEKGRGGEKKKKAAKRAPVTDKKPKAKAKIEANGKSKPKARPKPKKEDEVKSAPKASKSKKKSAPTPKKEKKTSTPAKASAKKSTKRSGNEASSGEPSKKRKYTKRSGGYWSNRSGLNSPTAKAMAKKAAAAAAAAKKGSKGAATATSLTPNDSSSPKKKRAYKKKSDYWKSPKSQKAADGGSAVKASGGGGGSPAKKRKAVSAKTPAKSTGSGTPAAKKRKTTTPSTGRDGTAAGKRKYTKKS